MCGVGVGRLVDSSVTVSWRPAVEQHLRLLSGRWVVAVLAALAQGELHSNELLAEINSVGGQRGGRGQVLDHRVLKDTTDRLVGDGWVLRHIDPTPHRSVRYELTRRGQALLGALRPLAQWAHVFAEQGEPLTWGQAVEAAVVVLRGRWVLAVLAALAPGPLRTNELLAEINSVEREGRALDARVLKDTTVRLVRDRLLVEHSPRRGWVRYELTQRGQALLVALRPLGDQPMVGL